MSIGRIVIWDSRGDLHSQLVFKFRQSLLIKSLTEKSVHNLYIILTAMLFNRFTYIDHANRIVFFEYPVKPDGIFHFVELITRLNV